MSFGIRRFISVNKGYKIIQIENLQKSGNEDYLYMKYPLVVLNTYTTNNLLTEMDVSKICEIFGNKDGYYSMLNVTDVCSHKAPKFDKISKITDLLEGDTMWKCLLNHTFIKNNDLYNPIHDVIKMGCPKLSINNRYSITVSSSGFTEPLQYSQSYKIMITSLMGTKVVRLFNPTYKNMLYMDHRFHPNYRMSKVNIWDDWDGLCKRYKKLKDTEYIDIILRRGNTIMIPNFWFFSTRNVDTNVTLYSKVDTLITHMFQLPYHIEKYLHYMGLYKVNNCYCHKKC